MNLENVWLGKNVTGKIENKRWFWNILQVMIIIFISGWPIWNYFCLLIIDWQPKISANNQTHFINLHLDSYINQSFNIENILKLMWTLKIVMLNCAGWHCFVIFHIDKFLKINTNAQSEFIILFCICRN